MKNKVLIITYYWPPAGGPGVQRWLKFVKFLREYNWEPVILTVKDGTYPSIDESLMNDIPEGIKVYKTKATEPFRIYNILKRKKGKSVGVALINMNKKRSIVDRLSMYIRSNFFIPDARKGWNPHALKLAPEIIKNEDIKVVVTTGPPQSTHLIGKALKQQLGISWLADFRDPWTNVYYNKMMPRSNRTEKKDKALEDSVLTAADVVSVVSPGLKSEFEDRAKSLEVIYNGFDDNDIQVQPSDKQSPQSLELVYTGNFKPNQHVPHIWDAIIELANEIPGFTDIFKLRFVGNVDQSAIQYFYDHNAGDIVETTSYVPHTEATRIMAQSSLLLFIIPQSDNNKLIITGKLFEYLASGTPIVSVGPVDGNAASILADAGGYKMTDYSDKESFKTLLKEYFYTWKKENGVIPKIESQGLQQFSRKYNTEKLAGILNKLKNE